MLTPSSAYQTEHNKSSRTPIYQVRLHVRHPLDSTLVAGLKGYWRLDESSGVRYDAIGLGNLQDNNTVTQAVGKIGNAARFASVNREYLSCSLPANSPLRTGDTDFAVGAWVYLETLSADQVIISQYGRAIGFGLISGWKVFFDNGNQQFRFTIRDDQSPGTTKNLLASSFGTPSINTWYYVAAWHDSTANLIKISVNDGAVDSLATAGIYPPSYIADPLMIGADNSGGTALGEPANFMNGRIDEVSFWKTVFA